MKIKLSPKSLKLRTVRDKIKDKIENFKDDIKDKG